MKSFVLSVGILWLAGSAPLLAQKGKASKAKEAVVQGKAISEWIKSLTGKELLDRVRAINALLQAGPEARSATPALLAVLADPDPGFLHPLAVVALSRIGADAVPELQKALDHKTPSVRARAAFTLGLIGSAARAAVPALIKSLKDADASVREGAAEALGRLANAGRPGVPALQAALEDADPSVQTEAAVALWRIAADPRGVSVLRKAIVGENLTLAKRAAAGLGEIGPKAKEAAPELRRVLANKDVGLRIAGAEALFLVTRDVAPARDVLAAAVQSPLANDRRSAISALGLLGADEKAVALLLQFLEDKDAETRREAASALVEMRANTPEVRKALEARLADRDAGVRWWCALGLASAEGDVRRVEEDILRAFRLALFHVGAGEPLSKVVVEVQVPRRAVPALVRVLQSRPVRLQVEAARALAQLGLDTQSVQQELSVGLATEDKMLRRALAEALAALGAGQLPQLVKMTGTADARLREGAARALGQMGVQARSSVPALTRLLTDPEASVRIQAALALWLLDQNAEGTLPILNFVLKDVDNVDRWEAIEAVGTIALESRPPIKGITEVLVNALKDRDVRVRLQAAKWLWRRTRQAKTVIPLLRESVTERDLLGRLTAIETLGEFSAEDRVVPLLTQALEDKDVGVRLAATEGLARGGADAVPQLIEALTAKPARVRLGVARALGLMGPTAQKAKPALEALSKDSDPGVRAAGAEALLRIGAGPG